MLKIKDIHTYYGDSYVLQGIDMEVIPQVLVGIIGRNGVGKTTLMRSVIGFNHPKKGIIIYDDVDITYMKPYEIARLGISLVPQGRQIFPSLNLEENLSVGISSRVGGWTLEKVYELFPPLERRKKQMGGLLSGGEQQMLAIGRSLMTNPSLLLMDEPCEGLAPLFVQTLGKIIRALHGSGIGIIMVEQKLSVVLRYTDYIHIISKGKIVYSSSPAEIKDNQEIRNRYLGV